MLYALVALGAYFLGSIPSGYLIGKARGVDLQKVGSGNIGATNVLRALGKKWGYFCFAADIGKGLAAVLLARTVVADTLGLVPEWSGITAAVCVILGHNFPVWLGFKGGKGIATSGGVVLGLFPPVVFLAGLLTWVGLFFATRMVSVASLGGSIMLPAALTVLWMFGWTPLSYVIVGTVMAALAVWRHRENIARILAGTEPRFERRKR